MENEIPDFANAVDVISTDQGEAINTQPVPDFGNSEDYVEDVPVPKEKRTSLISKFAQWFYGDSVLGRMERLTYVLEKIDEKDTRPIDELMNEHDEQQAAGGLEKVLETPMQVALAAGAVANPIGTAVGLAGYSALDKLFNLGRYVDEKFPNTNAEIRDVITVADFMLKGFIVGGIMHKGNKMMNTAKIAKNTNINSSSISNINKSVSLLESEKIDINKTLKITDAQIKASEKSGTPINVNTEDILNLAKKPYWEIAKAELLATPEKTTELALYDPMLVPGAVKGEGFVATPTLKESLAKAKKENLLERNDILSNIKKLQSEKNLSSTTVSSIKKFIGIEKIKDSEIPQLKKLNTFLSDLEKGDKFLSEKQITDLKSIIGAIEIPEVTPKRIIIDLFGEKSEILDSNVLKNISPSLIPTVDIKKGKPLISKIINNARELLLDSEKEIIRRNKKFDEMLSAAEKSRAPLLSKGERLARKILPQNKEIFEALGGGKVKLTPEETSVVAYARNFFNKAKLDLELQKYRRNYVTHIEKSFLEKILSNGISNAIRDIFIKKNKNDLPVDIMLELENIVGSEKFFRFSQKRTGGIDPTTNLREIINTYSSLYETKKALDIILPEGQAILKNLLPGKSAVWQKQFLQNLKGRGMDNAFRTSSAGWLAKTADAIIDAEYIKLLALDPKSGLKNIVAGETNSWIYQDFKTYLTGKKRFIENPKKAYQIAKEYGILEGTFAEYAQKGIGKLKKIQDASMIFQRTGEVEIRSSMCASMLTEGEWASGEIPQSKVILINDTVAKTQGLFSKIDTPLALQTWWGRMFFQMNRWRITNALLLGDISKSAYQDVKNGQYNTVNTTRFGKMLVAYSIGMYMSNELRKAGFSASAKVARSTAQTIDGTMSLFTEGQLIKMFTDNPTLHDLKAFSNTIQDFANYLNIPGSEPARGKGIEDTYIAPKETLEDLLNTLED